MNSVDTDKNIKIVIPGGAGLVGQNLVVRLLKLGYSNLVVLDKHKANIAILRQVNPSITAECVDLADAGVWDKYLHEAHVVVMLQAQIGDPTLDPFIRNNITATKNILAAISKHQVPYLVHVSSSVVNSVADDHYTNTKKEQEQIVMNSGISCVVLRPTLMFGLFDRKHLGWLSRFMKKMPIFPIPGNGKYMRQPLYAGDFSNIIISCIQSRISGQAFNITGLERIDYIDIIRSIKNATHANSLILKIPYSLFYFLLKTWALFDKNPPFTADQLQALVAHDEFEVINWPTIFNVAPTPFQQALQETFNDPEHSSVVLEF